MADTDNKALLVELGQVKGQLTAMTNMIQQNHQMTQTRIEDLSKSVGARFDGIEKRLGTLEQNERKTAINAAVSGATSGAIVAGAIALLRGVIGH